MNAKKLLGAAIIASPFIALFISIVLIEGWWMALSTFGGTALLIAILGLGVKLLYDS